MVIQCPRRIVSQHPTPLPALAPEKEKHVTSEGPPLPGVATECANVLVFVQGRYKDKNVYEINRGK